MKKRTKKEIATDFKKVIKLAEKATTFEEISKKTGLSYMQLKTTLGDKFEKVKEQLQANKVSASTQIEKNNLVIDASICAVHNVREYISEQMTAGKKFIVTSVTIRELDMLQKINDFSGRNARWLLAIAADNPENFKAVLINETLGIPDDCIISYCLRNVSTVELLCADKVMALKARCHNISVHYFKVDTALKPPSPKNCIEPFLHTKRVKTALTLGDLQRPNLSIRVISHRKEYNDGEISLQFNDDILVAMTEGTSILFFHYRVTSLQGMDNFLVIYSQKYDLFSKISLSEYAYMKFLKDFIKRKDLENFFTTT